MEVRCKMEKQTVIFASGNEMAALAVNQMGLDRMGF